MYRQRLFMVFDETINHAFHLHLDAVLVIWIDEKRVGYMI